MGSKADRATATRARVALAVFALSLAITAAAAAVHLTGGDTRFEDEWGLPGFEGMLALSCGAIGLLIARRSSNPTGSIFLSMSLGSALQYLTERYTIVGLEPTSTLPGVETTAWIAEWIWVPLIAGIGLLLLVFPDQRITSRGGRAIAGLGAIGATTTFFSAAFLNPVVANWNLTNPYALIHDRTFGTVAFNATAMTLMVAVVAAAATMVGRLRSATGIRRQQLKWFAYASVFASVSLVFSTIPATLGIASKFAVFGIIMISVASGIAILKYRLYDIDLVINRTLVYGALTAVLALFYVVLVFAFQALLSPFTAESDLAIAGSTLAVAALVRPARARIQGFIDRRFYRRKFDAERTLDAFAQQVRDQVDIGALSEQLTRVVSDTMQPAHVSLWLREAR